MSTTVQNEALGRALSKVVSGIYIMTTGSGDSRQGTIISWLMQAGFNPPRITVALAKDRPLVKHLEESPEFVINVLPENGNQLMKPFGKHTPGEDQFADLSVTENDYGVILNEAVAYLNCKMVALWDGGDHYIALADVVDGQLQNETTPFVHIRKNGFFY